MQENEARRGQPAGIDARVLRHLRSEIADLRADATAFGPEGGQCVNAAMALTRADWLLGTLQQWCATRLAGRSLVSRLDEPATVIGIEMHVLSEGLRAFVARVERLHARARMLDDLVANAPADAPPCGTAQVIALFDDPHEASANPVRDMRARLIRAMPAS